MRERALDVVSVAAKVRELQAGEYFCLQIDFYFFI